MPIKPNGECCEYCKANGIAIYGGCRFPKEHEMRNHVHCDEDYNCPCHKKLSEDSVDFLAKGKGSEIIQSLGMRPAEKEPHSKWEEEFMKKFHLHNGSIWDCDCDDIKQFIRQTIQAERTRLLEEIKEKMPREKEKENGFFDTDDAGTIYQRGARFGFNQCLSEVLKLLSEVGER